MAGITKSRVFPIHSRTMEMGASMCTALIFSSNSTPWVLWCLFSWYPAVGRENNGKHEVSMQQKRAESLGGIFPVIIDCDVLKSEPQTLFSSCAYDCLRWIIGSIVSDTGDSVIRFVSIVYLFVCLEEMVDLHLPEGRITRCNPGNTILRLIFISFGLCELIIALL